MHNTTRAQIEIFPSGGNPSALLQLNCQPSIEAARAWEALRYSKVWQSFVSEFSKCRILQDDEEINSEELAEQGVRGICFRKTFTTIEINHNA